MPAQDVKDVMNVALVSPSVLFLGLSWPSFHMNGKVVHVDGHPTLSDFSTEDHVHHHLEGSGGVGQPEEHDHWFEEAFWCEERRFPFISLFDADIVVSPAYVEFGEEHTACEAVNGLGNEGRYVSVLLSPPIDGSVVLDQTEFSVFLFDKEEVGGVGTP